MSDRYGMHVRFTAKPGRADELATILLEAAETGTSPDCLLYMISRAPEDESTVWVTEAWTSKQAHDESLKDPATRAVIDRAMPLMAAAPEAQHLHPLGGKGL